MHLVRAGDDLVLLGVGENGVTPIRTYGEDEARALGLLDDEDQPRSSRLPGAAGRMPARRAGPRCARALDDLRAKTVSR